MDISSVLENDYVQSGALNPKKDPKSLLVAEKLYEQIRNRYYDYEITPSTAHLDEDDKGHLILLINRMHFLAREGVELPPHFYTRY